MFFGSACVFVNRRGKKKNVPNVVQLPYWADVVEKSPHFNPDGYSLLLITLVWIAVTICCVTMKPRVRFCFFSPLGVKKISQKNIDVLNMISICYVVFVAKPSVILIMPLHCLPVLQVCIWVSIGCWQLVRPAVGREWAKARQYTELTSQSERPTCLHYSVGIYWASGTKLFINIDLVPGC